MKEEKCKSNTREKITSLPEEVLIEVLVRAGKYKIDDEVLEEATRLYDEKIAEIYKNRKENKTNKKQVLQY